MATRKALQIRSLSRDRISYVRLYGTIDETFDPAELARQAPGRDVILNLKALTRLSSFGVREWVRGIELLGAQADRISFVECSPAVVAQLNMVANFAGRAQVVSVQVPYFCEKCSWDTEVTRELDRDLRTELDKLPPVVCKRCKNNMSFDDDPASFFSFQSSGQPKKADSALLAFISDFAQAMDSEVTAPGTDPGEKSGANRSPIAASAKPAGGLAMLRQRLTPLLARWRALPMAARLGAAAGLIVVVAAAAWLSGERDDTPERLLEFQALVNVARFDAASALLDDLERNGRLSDVAVTGYRERIKSARASAADNERQRAVEAFTAKRWRDAADAAERAAVAGPLDADTLFAYAESLRALGKNSDAAARYAEVYERFPEDKRCADALFWHADHLTRIGEGKSALPLYQRVAEEFKDSKFRNQALQRLKGGKKSRRR